MADKALRRLAWSMSMAVLMTALSLTLSAPATATTTASCTSVSIYYHRGLPIAEIPTIGRDTGQDNCLLGVGNQSVAVQVLQDTLKTCYRRNITVDGIFGPQTRSALQHAQRAEHIPADGVYGPQTRDHLRWLDIASFGCVRL